MKTNRLTLALPALALLLSGCVRMPLPATPPPSPAPCPCPDLALAHHPEDPDSPGECKARSRTGVVMDAGDHPACGREARERREQTP